MFDALQRVHYNSRNSPLVTGASFYISEREHIMANKVTIQDIANALGISRNTVSKAINNTGVLADATREKVLKKAAEMGYKQFSYFTAANLDKQEAFVQNSAKAGEIALLTTVFWGKSYFISTIVDTFQRELSRFGYRLTMHRVLDREVEDLKLPDSLDSARISGLLCLRCLTTATAGCSAAWASLPSSWTRLLKTWAGP